MAEGINELQKQILEKNSMLDSLNSETKPKKEKIREVKTELDDLLYKYYKSIKCKCSNSLFVCFEA